MRASMTLQRWRHRSGFVMSARRYAAFARVCFRPIRGLRMSSALFVQISAKPVLQSAENTNMSRRCGNLRRPAPAVLRHAGRLLKLGPFERPHRTGIWNIGTTVLAVILSAWGQQSGGHFNPALTLAFFRLGTM